MAVASGVDPFVPALAATFAASFGFMLPVSTPQNAIVYGSACADHPDGAQSASRSTHRRDLIIIGVPVMVSALGIGG